VCSKNEHAESVAILSAREQFHYSKNLAMALSGEVGEWCVESVTEFVESQ